MNSINIQVEEFVVGKNVFIHPSASIRGIGGAAKKIVLGDHVYIGEQVQIISDDFSIGDYSKIHHHTNIHGYKPCHIGHNAWIGQHCIIDSIGSVTIGNNCGIGAQSQLWSHIKYGDTLEGCNYNSENPLIIGHDVWLVGHCIVSPVTIDDKVMVLAGSVVTKNLESNQVYAGTPAKALSSKEQFHPVSAEEKYRQLKVHLRNSMLDDSKIKVVLTAADFNWENDCSYFEVSTRTYTKKHLPDEIAFMKYLLPEKGKFIPAEK